MPWNWDLPDWPNFTWDAAQMAPLEQQFAAVSGQFRGSHLLLSPEGRAEIEASALTENALTTSEIEGETLRRESVRSSIEGHLGLNPARIKASSAERGIAELMVHTYQTASEPLSRDLLFTWHRFVMAGSDHINAGRYRTVPMEILSGNRLDTEPTIVFQAPPADRVTGEMDGFIAWYNACCDLPHLTRAGLAHLYFECIHPFEDGNGRVGRAISTKALAEKFDVPTYPHLSHAIAHDLKNYYRELDRASQALKVTEWLLWFGQTTLAAQQTTNDLILFIARKSQTISRAKDDLNERQFKALRRLFEAGPEGWKGGFSAKNYMSITAAAESSATRDLADMVAKGYLTRTGERRYTRYFLAN